MNRYQKKKKLLENFHQFYTIHLITWLIQLPVDLKNSLLFLISICQSSIDKVTVFRKQLLK